MSIEFAVNGSRRLVTVDDEDRGFSRLRWRAVFTGKRTVIARDEGGTTVYLHRRILQSPGPVDFRDEDPFNCRRGNLRELPYTAMKSKCGLGKNNVSGFKGVSQRPGGLFRVRIQCGAMRRSEGGIRSPRDAGMLYDAWARELFGEFAVLNFP